MISLLKDPKTYKWAGVGLLALAGDYGLYNYLLDIVGMDLAKLCGTFVGVNISFNLNRIWTFKSHGTFFEDLKRYMALYLVAIIVNVSVNNLAFRILEDIDLAYIAALFVSVTIGYFGQRLWVFKNRTN
tara:strand:+ start:25 stop:411 length:387 start_codon:yes stop_codon:yes gene_type:complete